MSTDATRSAWRRCRAIPERSPAPAARALEPPRRHVLELIGNRAPLIVERRPKAQPLDDERAQSGIDVRIAARANDPAVARQSAGLNEQRHHRRSGGRATAGNETVIAATEVADETRRSEAREIAITAAARAVAGSACSRAGARRGRARGRLALDNAWSARRFSREGLWLPR